MMAGTYIQLSYAVLVGLGVDRGSVHAQRDIQVRPRCRRVCRAKRCAYTYLGMLYIGGRGKAAVSRPGSCRWADPLAAWVLDASGREGQLSALCCQIARRVTSCVRRRCKGTLTERFRWYPSGLPSSSVLTHACREPARTFSTLGIPTPRQTR